MWDQWDAVVPHGEKVGCGVGFDRYTGKNTIPLYKVGVSDTGVKPEQHPCRLFFAVFRPSLPPHEVDGPALNVIRCATEFCID